VSTPLPNEAPLRDDDASASRRGSTSLGKYRLIARLGTGGMAEVFLAVAQGAMNVNRLVVVKRLRDEQADDAASRTMFLNEARLAARLAHPNVIQTFEAGAEAGGYFLAMEYVDGQPLSRLLSALRRGQRRMDPKVAARILSETLQGLHYAHELKDFDGSELAIVHRDVSPQNIMVTFDGVVKIVDFGIAKAASTAQTEHGVFKGKVAFMAPEQLVGHTVDRRADIFAAGIVLWEALTGKHLMAAETPAKTLYNLIHMEIPRVSAVVPDFPPVLDDIVARALERDVDRRYATAREMRDALESYIASAGGIGPEPIGTLVTTFFADTRARVQNEVKAQLAVLSLARQSDPALRINPHLSGTHIRTESETLIDLSDVAQFRTASMSAGSFRVRTTAGALAVPSRTNRALVVCAVVVMLGALGASGLALSRTLRPATAAPPPSAPPTMAPTIVTVTAPVVAAPPPAITAPAPSATSTADAASAPATATTAAHPPSPPAAAAPPPPRWWSPPPPKPAQPTAAAPTPSTPPPPSAEAVPKPAASAPAPAPPKASADNPQGRIFRRDL
jgi:serine/threonine protein kinase